MNNEEIRKYLAVIKKAVEFIESKLDEKPLEQPPIKAKSVVADNQPVAEKSPQFALREKHISDLMAIDCWPDAIPSMIAKVSITDKDQLDRANAVLATMLNRSLENLSFLDFGCGEGWIAKQAIGRGVKESYGYDIKESEKWQELNGVAFTNQFDNLPKKHFDAIMLYDVLDHCDNPILVMNQIKQVLKDDGIVYVRCHPWTSAHATHVFKQGLNKAYIHLFLTPLEIAKLTGQPQMFTRMEKDATPAYHWWFNQYKIQKESFKTEKVSDFFYVPAFKELLANEQRISFNEIDDFLKRMEIQFIDYQLTNI